MTAALGEPGCPNTSRSPRSFGGVADPGPLPSNAPPGGDPLLPPTSFPDRLSIARLFGSPAFFRLWLGQFASSLGDWIGLIAITGIAARLGKSNPGAAVGLVLSARLIPGFLLGSVIGVFIDRWDRRRVMIACDIGRGLVLMCLPLVHDVIGLFFASLLLEVMTLMWGPAKEASVPNMVPEEFIPTANSLSLGASYGTFPIAGAVSFLLASTAKWLGDYSSLGSLQLTQENVAIYFDVFTYFVSACMVFTLTLPPSPKARARADGEGNGKFDLGETWRDVKEGWRFIRTSPLVLSVIVGLATGLIGGGMIVPLGQQYSTDVLKAGQEGYGLYLTALGVGVALGIVGLSIIQRRVPAERVFVVSLLGAGGSLIAAATVSTLVVSALCIAGLGFCAGAVYVLGFSLLQTNVSDDLRGRIFVTLYTIIRFCLLMALVVAPVLSSLLNGLSGRLLGADKEIGVGGVHLALPGVRLTLWLGGSIIIVAGVLATRALRRTVKATSPASPGATGATP